MQPKFHSRLLLGSSAITLALTAPSAHALNPVYWETNQTTPGFGTANGQTWLANTLNLWSTSSAGTGFAKGSYITSTIDKINFGSDKAALGGGTVNVSGSVDAGTIRFWSSAGNILLAGGTINLADTTSITVDNSSDTITSTLTGAATSLIKDGTGLLVLTAANNYSGATNVNAGTLVLSGGSANLNASSTVTVASGGHLQFSPSGDNGTYEYNSFSLNLTGQGAYNDGNQTVSFQPANNNTYNLGGNVTVAGGVQFYTYGINNIVNLGGVFSGTGDMSFVGNGLDHHDFRFTGNSANSGYAGTYRIYSQITWTYAKLAGGNNTLPITASVDLESQQGDSAAILDLNGNSQELAGLTSGGDHTNNNWVQNNGPGTPTLTINNAGDNVYTGILGNGGNSFALTKAGAGTLTFTRANTYTGATNLNGGTLTLGASNILPDGTDLTIGTATLDSADGISDTANFLITTGSASLHLGTGAALAFADSSSISWSGTLAITGNFISGISLRFGTTSSGLTPTQLAAISATGFSGFALDINGYLTATASGGYSTWAATNAPSGTANDDYDGDGVNNGVEYVLGGTHLSNDLSKLPASTTSGGDVIFTFNRAQASIDATTTVAIQVGTDLNTWPQTYSVPGSAQTNNPGVTVSKDTSPGFDTITLTVPRAPDTVKFTRLVVSITP